MKHLVQVCGAGKTSGRAAGEAGSNVTLVFERPKRVRDTNFLPRMNGFNVQVLR